MENIQMFDEKEFNKRLGEIIIRLRTNKNYSTEKLAEFSSTDYSAINQIENGKQNPKSYMLYKRLYALDIDIMEPIISKEKERANLEDSIIEKIKKMNDENLSSALAFWEDFEIHKNKTWIKA